MSIDIDELISDIRKTAKTAGRAFGKMADKSSKATEEMVEYTKIKIKITELENQLEDLFEGIGRKLYGARSGEEVPDFSSDFETADDLKDKLTALKARAEELRKKRNCRTCGRKNDRNAVFCQWCGDKVS